MGYYTEVVHIQKEELCCGSQESVSPNGNGHLHDDVI